MVARANPVDSKERACLYLLGIDTSSIPGGHCKRKQFHLKLLFIPTNLHVAYTGVRSKAWKVAAIRSAFRVTNAALRSIKLPCRTLYLHLYQKPGLRPVYLAEKSVKYEDLPGHAFLPTIATGALLRRQILLQRICIWAKAAGPCRCRPLRLGRANGLSPWPWGRRWGA